MKVLLLSGSPRKGGNTTRALQEVATALEAQGIETELMELGPQAVRGCTACGWCSREGKNQCVFNDDLCNEFIAKAATCDGFVVGSPVYYAGANGSLISLLDRAFYAGGSVFRYKPAAGVAVARRAGTTLTVDQINKYFQINCMPVVSSSYWTLVHGREKGEAAFDGEGLHTMRVLGDNMAWLLKCIAAGKDAGIEPSMEPKIMTNFVRSDLEG